MERSSTTSSASNLELESALALRRVLFASLKRTPPWLDFLHALDKAMQCHHATVVLRKPREGDRGVLVSTQESEAALRQLQERMFRDSPFLELPPEQVCILSQMMTQEEFRTKHAEYANYMLEGGNAVDLIGVDIQDEHTGMVARFRGARITGEPSFSEDDKRLLLDLLPDLKIATALYARIALQDYRLRLSSEAEGKMAIGSLVLDRERNVLMANTEAEHLLDLREEFYLRDNKLHCNSAANDRALGQILKSLSDGSSDTENSEQVLTIPRADGLGGWSLLFRCEQAHPGLAEQISAPILLLIRTQQHIDLVNEQMLMDTLGLTPAEAQLTVLLVKGQSLAQAAEALGRSQNTVRVQLTSVFHKTNCNRQPALVSHVLQLASQLWH